MQRVSKRADGSLSVETINTEPTMTQQQFQNECDVNLIMKKYEKTGEFTHLTSKQGIYADFSEIKDYHQMKQQLIEAELAFETLPPQVRLKYNNNPGDLIDALNDPKQQSELVELGILNPIQELIKPSPSSEIKQP
ncbi:MAG: internal scaffolding protein [Microvirus sp.]|nr:MAG: internal scaffolding protein [Microvirus sp.]